MTGSRFHMVAGAPAPVAPFSHAVEADGWVMLSGQMPTDPADPEAPLPADIEGQTRQVIENLRLVLAGLGLDLSHVVRCRCYLTHFQRDYEAFNAVWDSGRRPARTTVGVAALALGALIEVDVTARRPGGEGGR